MYMRQGVTEGSYYQPVHQVQYYRYIRFFQNGTVTTVLSLEAPKQTLPFLVVPPSELSGGPRANTFIKTGVFVIRSDDKVTLDVQDFPLNQSRRSYKWLLSISSSRSGWLNRAVVEELFSVSPSDAEPLLFPIEDIAKYTFVKFPRHLQGPPSA